MAERRGGVPVDLHGVRGRLQLRDLLRADGRGLRRGQRGHLARVRDHLVRLLHARPEHRFTGPLVDRFGPRPVLLAGALALGAGLTLTSMVEQLWLGYVTYGLGVGIAVASKPPVRLGGVPRPLRTTTRSPAFAALYGSMLLMSIALIVPFVFLPPHAVANGASGVAGGTLVGLIGISSVVGRLGLGFVADRFGRIRVYRLCFVTMAGSFAIWLLATDYPWLVAFAMVFGLGYGGFIALNPAVVAEAFGVVGLGAIVGVLYTSAGLGSLIGPPLAGVIIDATGTYTWAILGAMAATVTAAVVLVPLGNLRTAA